MAGPVLVDIEGYELQSHECDRIQHPLVGGLILFSRNYKDPSQLKELTQQIKEARAASTDSKILITVDHEGGRVQRFKTEGFTHIVSMASLGRLYDRYPESAIKVATEFAYIMAMELLSCGVDFSYAPVLDLDYGFSTVIGDRAFHKDPKVVAILSRAFIQGLSKAGMASCGKHFPGHGYVEADSHIAIPEDDRTLDEILSRDTKPYEWLGDLVLPSVMLAHVIYTKVDKHNACFSKVWVQDILRNRLGYDGLIFSDDLTMEGASYIGDITARGEAALNAGCDMVMVCNKPNLADELLEKLDYNPNQNPNLERRLNELFPKYKTVEWDELAQSTTYKNARCATDKVFS
ncbi:beta-hexosaminidase [Taylorella equigenitalis 14/56]|uniref:Beta-hexosaminidase n=2 Tax=Taylorella equigenitalis TaxID=29575 RepID=I7JNU4_9BURK|nr:beta-N-acetylhexosaminidase [Taylorella equigenitalis]AFN35964.1 beta-hexosaminidase [Taylorella equigenitalis ATCC 35865]ASY39374.1 beta-N-acetylhexosaminidase [Taylorella equigenitalis]CCG17715.1 beta-hexosaminidase [Taylorella equigenitalis 14/56]VEG31476.1 Beta-hexosaminidase [Taylorella equigenitalis ATCC 35865]